MSVYAEKIEDQSYGGRKLSSTVEVLHFFQNDEEEEELMLEDMETDALFVTVKMAMACVPVVLFVAVKMALVLLLVVVF